MFLAAWASLERRQTQLVQALSPLIWTWPLRILASFFAVWLSSSRRRRELGQRVIL